MEIESQFAELIAATRPDQAQRFRNSVGPNFGTTVVTGFSAWPVNNPIPDAMLEAAVNILAFDALIDNPDRRLNNPNLFVQGDRLLIYDHEFAFSFLLAIVPTARSWLLEGQPYLREHAFYRRLKSRPLDLARFTAGLNGLSDAVIDGIEADVPTEWRGEGIDRIWLRLRGMREHAGEFMEAIRRLLV